MYIGVSRERERERERNGGREKWREREMEGERDGGRDGAVHTVDLLADELVDVNDVLAAVNGRDLALAALVGSTGDDDLIVLADRDRANLFINTIFQLAYTCKDRDKQSSCNSYNNEVEQGRLQNKALSLSPAR